MKNALFMSILFIMLVGTASAGQTFDYNYANITVSDNPGISNYEAKATVEYRDNMSTNFANIRFFDMDGNSLPYWIESYTASDNAVVWLPVDSGDNVVQVRWAIPGETASESDAVATFVYYDNFDDLTGWTVEGEPSSVANSKLTVAADSKLTSTESISWNGVIAESFLKPDGTFRMRVGTQKTRSVLYDVGTTWMIWDEPISGILATSHAGPAITENIYGLSKTIYDGSSIKSYWNNTLAVEMTTVDSSSQPIYISHWGGLGTTEFDWIRVRKYAATEPTLTMGATESHYTTYANAVITMTGDDNLVLDYGASHTFNFTTSGPLSGARWYINGVPMVLSGTELTRQFDEGNEFYNISVVGLTGDDTTNMISWSVHTKREMATSADEIQQYDDENYNNFRDNFTNFDSTNMTVSAVTPFTDLMGRSFYLILFVMPFILLWQKQQKLTIPATLGLITGCLFIGFVPDQYREFLTYAVILSFAVNLFFIGRERT